MHNLWINKRERREYVKMTKLISVDNLSTSQYGYKQAVDTLRNGEVVAFPTETVYGLGAIATHEEAVAKIFEAKGRPQDNPLIVHIADRTILENFIDHVPDLAKACMDAFWPGPLTVILPLKPGVLANNVTAGLQTVGVRMPDHPVALQLLELLKEPVAAPSANKSGKPSPTKASHVLNDLNEKIPLILDGGITGLGLESTVVDFTLETPTILRPGGVTKEMLEKVVGPVNESRLSDSTTAPKAPGMKYAHYAPEAPVFLIEASQEKISEAIKRIHKEEKKVALISVEQYANEEADSYFTLGDAADMEKAAHLLYEALRFCDKTDVDVVLIPAFPEQGIGKAIMNRLEKAANGNWFPN